MSSDPTTAPVGSHDTRPQPTFVDPEEAFAAGHVLLGHKWHLPIVHQLCERGAMGFSELKTAIEGVSSKMLSESLTRLEELGLLDRRVVSEKPFRVNYSLTDRGRDLEPLVGDLLRWSDEHELTGLSETA